MLFLALSFAAVLSLRSIRKSFAVESFNVGVYFDFECSEEVKSIDWGNFTPGSSNTVEIFLRNEEINQPAFIYLWPEGWEPYKASKYITLSWDYDGRSLHADQKIAVTLTLEVSRFVIGEGITDFSFSIIILGSELLLGDLNNDAVIDIFDVVDICAAYDSTPLDPNWNPLADFNNDNIIDIYDVTILCQNYGSSYRQIQYPVGEIE